MDIINSAFRDKRNSDYCGDRCNSTESCSRKQFCGAKCAETCGFCTVEDGEKMLRVEHVRQYVKSLQW